MDTDKEENATDTMENSIDAMDPFPALDFAGEPYHTVKDSVFKRLFLDPKYLLQLYQTLHPEDMETTTEDFHLVTLDTIIIKDIHNVGNGKNVLDAR